jgi:two-component system, NtrC family, response regulator AtoC
MLPVLRLPKQGTSLEEIERALVAQAVRQAEGNQSQAAKMLDITRDALRYKMKKFGFEVDGEEQ